MKNKIIFYAFLFFTCSAIAQSIGLTGGLTIGSIGIKVENHLQEKVKPLTLRSLRLGIKLSSDFEIYKNNYLSTNYHFTKGGFDLRSYEYGDVSKKQNINRLSANYDMHAMSVTYSYHFNLENDTVKKEKFTIFPTFDIGLAAITNYKYIVEYDLTNYLPNGNINDYGFYTNTIHNNSNVNSLLYALVPQSFLGLGFNYSHHRLLISAGAKYELTKLNLDYANPGETYYSQSLSDLKIKVSNSFVYAGIGILIN
jgi:hypothetical protein